MTWTDLSSAELRARLINRSPCACSQCVHEIHELVRRRDDPHAQKRITIYLRRRAS